MNEVERQMIRDLFGELDVDESAELQGHLVDSPDMKRERDRYQALLAAYRRLDDEGPPPVSVGAVIGARERSEPGLGRRAWIPRLAAGLLIALVAFMAGRATRDPAASAAMGTLDGLEETLRAETELLRRDVALMALRQDRVTARIAAIEDLARAARSDPSLGRPLVELLRDDPSVNARLAVVDALYAVPEVSPEAGELADILTAEPDRALRLALLEWLVAAQVAGWRDLLRVVGEEDVDRTVRSRAVQLLEEWS